MRVLPIALLLALLLATPAASAASGATVTSVSFCHVSGPDTFCSTLFLVTQERTTASGTTIYQLRERTRVTVTDQSGQIIAQETGRDHIQTVTKQGAEHVSLRSASHTVTALGETCTDAFRYHLAKGVLQIDEFDFSCT